MLRRGMVLLLVGFLIVMASPLCFAQEVNPFTKFSNGLMNVLTGWTEVPRQVSETYGDGNNMAEALTIGVLKGVIFAAGRTLAGGVDTAFFFIPPYDKPLVEPLYQWGGGKAASSK